MNERPCGRFRDALLSEQESRTVIDDVTAWCRRTGTNYNKLVTAARVAPSTRSLVRRQKRRLTLETANRLRSTMLRYPQGISKAEHKSRLEQRRTAVTVERIPPRIVDRTPCPRCGVRADIGCRHVWSANRLRSI